MKISSLFNFWARRAGAARLGLLGSLLMLGQLPAAETAAAVTPLFNGRNLDGWYVYLQDRPAGAPQDIVQVNDGVIHLYKDAAATTPQPFGYLITNAEYSDYHLTLEYQWGRKKFAPRAGADTVRDAGVCYHVLAPDVIWPTSVECQIQEGDTGDVWLIHTRATSHVHRDNMNSWTVGQPGGVDLTKGDNPTGYQRFLRSYCYEQPGWNRVELIVRGDTATYLVNGHIANRVTGLKHWDAAAASWQPLTKGKILLQAEGAEIFYRNITLQPLATPPGS
jgi:Domain of Unknown Function (DUF1080)